MMKYLLIIKNVIEKKTVEPKKKQTKKTDVYEHVEYV